MASGGKRSVATKTRREQFSLVDLANFGLRESNSARAVISSLVIEVSQRESQRVLVKREFFPPISVFLQLRLTRLVQ